MELKQQKIKNKIIPLELIIEIIKTEKNVNYMKTMEIFKDEIKMFCFYSVNLLTSSKIFFNIVGNLFKEKKIKIFKLFKQMECVIDTLGRMSKEFQSLLRFVYLPNNWSQVDEVKNCCQNNCNSFFEKCENNCGWVELQGANRLTYNVAKVINKEIKIMARNYFISDVGYEFSKFFYFYETKIIQLQGDDLRYVVEIGLKNDNSEVKLCIDGENISDPESDDDVGVCINYDKNDKEGVVDIEGLTLKEGDFLGCGIVFPPRSNSEESPFVFFTHNKKQIGKGIVVDKGSSNFRPFICLKSASVDTNFGCDMENCFNFNVLLFQHFVSNEYYSEEDFEKEEMEED